MHADDWVINAVMEVMKGLNPVMRLYSGDLSITGFTRWTVFPLHKYVVSQQHSPRLAYHESKNKFQSSPRTIFPYFNPRFWENSPNISERIQSNLSREIIHTHMDTR